MDELLSVTPEQQADPEQKSQYHPDDERDDLWGAAVLDGNTGLLDNRKGRCTLLNLGLG